MLFRSELLERSSANESVDIDVSILSESVGAVHGLQVVCGVPVRIEDDDLVRG